MLVRFIEIPVGGLRLNISDTSWFPDHELSRTGALHADVFLERKQDRVLLEGNLEATLCCACDRCLVAYQLPLRSNFRVDFELQQHAPELDLPADHLCGPSEMDVIVLEEPVLNIFEILKQQMYLAMPMKYLCREDCRGLCKQCGADLNQSACDCDRKIQGNPFRVLNGLKAKD